MDSKNRRKWKKEEKNTREKVETHEHYAMRKVKERQETNKETQKMTRCRK